MWLSGTVELIHCTVDPEKHGPNVPASCSMHWLSQDCTNQLGQNDYSDVFLRTLAICRWYPDPRYYHFPLPNDVNIKNDLPISLKTLVSQDESTRWKSEHLGEYPRRWGDHHQTLGRRKKYCMYIILCIFVDIYIYITFITFITFIIFLHVRMYIYISIYCVYNYNFL